MSAKKIITKLLGDKKSRDFKSLGDTFYNPKTGSYESLAPLRKSWATKHPGKKGPMGYTIEKRKAVVKE